MRRIAFSAALLLLATLIQVTVLDNLRLPFGAGPDLVLVVVVALALTGGPVEGMLGGFCAGLALDVAPPATHLVGQYALVFCLVGYAAGRVGSHLDESAWVPIGVVAVGSAAGELLFALTGMMFGNLDITWSAVGQVLPASVVYDVLLSPFVLYAVVRARALAAPALATPGLASFPGGSARAGMAGRPRGVPGLAARGPVLRLRCGAARQRDRASPEAESPCPAGRVDPGGLGQRDAARPGPAVPADAPEVQRRRLRPVQRRGRRPGRAGTGVPAGEPAPGHEAPAPPRTRGAGREARGRRAAGCPRRPSARTGGAGQAERGRRAAGSAAAGFPRRLSAGAAAPWGTARAAGRSARPAGRGCAAGSCRADRPAVPGRPPCGSAAVPPGRCT